MTMLLPGGKRWLVLLLVASLLFAMGCDDGDKPKDPEENPAEALKAQAILFDSQFFNQIDVVRIELNAVQQQLTPFDPTSANTEQELLELVALSTEKLWWAGVVDTDGIVRNVYPDSLERFINENRIEIPAVTNVLAEEQIDAGPVLILEDGRRAIDYYRSIVDNGSVVGAAFAGLALDTLISRSKTFIDFSDSTGYHLFLLDELGQIVHDDDPSLIGLNVHNSTRFGEAADMVADMDENSEGSGTYSLLELGTGPDHQDGIYYVGWIRRAYPTDHYLTFAISQFKTGFVEKNILEP